MGGSGSGSWYRWSKKDTISDYNNLNMKRLVEEGIVGESKHKIGSWQWLRSGEVTSSISYTSNTLTSGSSYLRLRYTNKNSDQEYDYKVHLTTTSPNYGGKRWWFICPAKGCGRRVGVLYGGKIFACRHCYNLAYDSQNDGMHYRMLTKAQNIHRKLGGSGCTMDYVKKPKGMHWKTYNRLMEEMEYYDNASMTFAAKKLGLIDGF
ncbi:MAG: hypothetical protein COV35_04515 [Alphaproteobacteria bacterium CG11_big_fil_rev_8_21_14_0_20_39_49]|nr:MAG: hypothetical protein COV35_04515 [Alphaproteobacteria bacterium CG11_big_fil_rev_8_21_14_0_20_39_49]